jgi:hypothetical protein
VELKIDLSLMSAALKTALQNSITNATLYAMYTDATKRAAAVATTTLATKTRLRRRLTAAGETVATTKVEVANAAEATSAKQAINTGAATMSSNLLASVKAIDGIAAAVPGGLAALTVSEPVSVTETKTVTVTPAATTVSPASGSGAYNVRNNLGEIALFVGGALLLQVLQ